MYVQAPWNNQPTTQTTYNLKSMCSLQKYHPLSNVDQISSTGLRRNVGDNIQNFPMFDELYALNPSTIAPVDT